MVIFNVNRSGYSTEQVENETITVRELIKILENENPNDKVFFSNDNGYTYGYINENVITSEDY